MTSLRKLYAFVAVVATATQCYQQQAICQDPPKALATLSAERPVLRGLDSNLYMQTSAEYRAACYQAFNLATMKVQVACTEQRKDGEKPMAVVMDLDETVLDNAGFQATMLRSGLAYDQRLWDLWEEKYSKNVGLVPGVKEFLGECEKRGIAVFHISNRNDKFRSQTKALLERLAIPVKHDENLKLATDTSDKTKRREEVEAAFTVVVYVGDNLRDFDEQFKCPKLERKDDRELDTAIKARKDRVDATRGAWGNKWIILPNPAYGEWTKPLGLGDRDLDRLVPAAVDK